MQGEEESAVKIEVVVRPAEAKTEGGKS